MSLKDIDAFLSKHGFATLVAIAAIVGLSIFAMWFDSYNTKLSSDMKQEREAHGKRMEKVSENFSDTVKAERKEFASELKEERVENRKLLESFRIQSEEQNEKVIDAYKASSMSAMQTAEAIKDQSRVIEKNTEAINELRMAAEKAHK